MNIPMNLKRQILRMLLTLLPGATLVPLLQAQQIPVVPYPQEVKMGSGEFEPKGGPLTVYIRGIEEPTLGIVTGQLQEAFAGRYGVELVPGDRRPDLWIGLPAGNRKLMQLAEEEGIVPGEKLGQEGYVLKTEKNRIFILANGQAGAFYGVQTLVQLLRGTPDPEQLPLMTIRDWPSIDFRCLMDDISRGPIPTSDYLKQQVRRYAELKMNRMSFYIEHAVETEAYPDFAPSKGGIPVEEFAELSEYAKGYHIELVGNFQSLGHFERIMEHPQFRHLGATHRMLDPLNPEAIGFLRTVYREMTPAFSSEIFTPNLDEAWDLSRGGLSGPAEEIGVEKIYADHVKRIDTTLRELGKQTLVWGDIILANPGILEMLPKHIILGAWDYSPRESFAHFIDPLKEAGFDFTVTPGVLNSNRIIPDFRMSTVNVRNFINEGYEKGTVGVYCTVWDDGGPHFFTHTWYGVAYNAEQSWRPNREPLEQYDERFSRGVYGDAKNLVPRALHALNHLTDLNPTFEMNSNVFFKTLVPERGDKITFNEVEWKEVKRWVEEARSILTGGFLGAYDPDLAFLKFAINQYSFLADSRMELLAAADSYNRACRLQRNDRPAATEELTRTLDRLVDLRRQLRRLTDDFAILWDMESREHWRDIALSGFEDHSAAMADQISLLEDAIDRFGRGDYLPPPTDVRLDIRRQEGQFFPYWLIAGSFPIDTFEHSRRDFLLDMGGEAAARPFPGQKFRGPSGKEFMWDKYDSPKQGEVEFKTIFEPHETAVAYAYCTIDSPEKQQVTGLLGSNDGATVWLNGNEVYHFHGKRSLIPDEEEIPLELEEGRNHLLIKVEQWKAGWGFAFRLKDVEIRNHKQKYYIQ